MTDISSDETSDLFTSESSEDPGPARIYPLVGDPGNEQLLVEWLDSVEEYEVVREPAAIQEASFDLCIVDQQTLTEKFEVLERQKQAEQPVLLPYLLLLPDEDPEFLRNERGQLPDTLVQDTIDEMLSLPVRQFELRWRIESLLRMRDQTRKLASRERELRQFRRAVTAAGHAIYITDADGTIRYVNPAFEQLTGYSESEAIGETPELLNSGEMSDGYYDDLWETIRAANVWEEEIIDERKNGDRYHASQTIAPIRRSGGDVHGFVAIQTDITDLKESQEKRRQYQQAIDSSVELLAAIDNDDEYLFTNGSYREYHGIEAEEIRGRALQDVLESETLETVEPCLEAVRDGETMRFETTRTHPEKGERVFDVLYYPLVDEDGAIQGITGSLRDITNRKERERELRQKNRAIDEAPIGITITDPNQEDNPIIYVNDAFTGMTGYAESEVLGRNCRFLQGEKTDQESVARLRKGIAAEQPASVTIRNYRPDGSDFWNHLEIAPVRDEDDNVINFVGFQQDVTELRERQQQLQVIDRVLRHNLHNDLNVVQSMAGQIQREGDGQVSEYAQRIIDTGDALLETIDKQREITALLEDKPQREDVELASMLRSVADVVRAEYPSASIEVSAPEQAVVRATSQIRNAIDELLRNAVVHSQQETPHVTVTVSNTDGVVAVQIADNGPIIPEMERDILLGREEETPLYHGKGLGLWLVQLIVRRSSGSIDCTENEPRGNVITISLNEADSE